MLFQERFDLVVKNRSCLLSAVILGLLALVEARVVLLVIISNCGALPFFNLFV